MGLCASRTILLLRILKVVYLSYGFILIQLMKFHSEDELFSEMSLLEAEKMA